LCKDYKVTFHPPVRVDLAEKDIFGEFAYVFELSHIKSHRRCECNQHEVLYVIATQVAYVIKPRKCTLR